MPYTGLDQANSKNKKALRSTVVIFVLAGLLLATAAYLFVRPGTLNEPQPVAMGETAIQQIRDEDGKVETWTYTKKEMSELQQSDEPTAVAPPPTGAATVPNEQALNAWSTGDIRGAMDLFEAAIAADPNDPAPHSNYGRRLTSMVAYEKALPLLLRASELSPDDPQVWLDLLTLYEKSLQFSRANAARQRAQELAGDRALVRNEYGAWLLEGNSLP